MRKLFRLANAEFNKIFYRPSMFILVTLLIIALVLSNLAYKPVSKTTQLSYISDKVGGVYNMFVGSEEKINKNSIDKSLYDAYISVKNQYESITEDNKLKTFKDMLGVVNTDIQENIVDERIYLTGLTETNFIIKKNDIINTFKTYQQHGKDVLNYMAATIKNETLNFYITYTQYDVIYENVKKYVDTFPENYDEYSKKLFIDLANSINESFNISTSMQVLKDIQNDIVRINKDDYNNLVKIYYTDAVQKLNDVYFAEIENIYNESFDSKEAQDIAKINLWIAKYNSFATMNTNNLLNSFTLLRVSDKSDTDIPKYLGYGDVSKYHLNEDISINKYMLDNEEFDFNYLTSFNYNKSSGPETNAYDYTVYSMQILSLFIILFTIYYACSSIAGDQASGTMKMIAIRPYTRNKLYAGKYLACLLFGGLLMIISLIAAFVVGAVSYGIPNAMCLVVFNASNVIIINPMLLMAYYFASLFVNLMFYVSLAMFISIICRSNTLSLILSTIIYAVQVAMCGVVNQVWLKYTLFGHFDLFKYFGNSQPGLLSLNILPEADFFTSLIVIGIAIVALNSLSHLIFQRRDIS